jgi:hypothetical protein
MALLRSIAMTSDAICIDAPSPTWLWASDECARSRRIYAKAVDSQWDPDRDIDWTLEVPFGDPLPPDAGLPAFLNSPLGAGRRELWNRFRWEYQLWLISQFYHGEQSALVGAARIAQTVRELDAKQAAAAQVMDEARHIEVFRRYLQQHCPTGAYGVSPAFAALVSNSLTDARWDIAVLGIQVMVEGVALATFRMAETTLHDDLIRSIVRLVHRDEARHVSFGTFTLQNFYRELSEYERRERRQFIMAGAELTARRFLLEDVWDRLQVDRQQGARFAATDPTMSAYRRIVFMKVMTIARTIGLLDGPLQRDFALLGAET